MRNFWALFRAEWTKTMRMRSTYIAFLAAGVLVGLVQFGLWYGAEKSDFYEFLTRNGFKTTLLVNAFISTRIALETGFILLMAPMVIMTFARQISQEDLRGTLRLMLVRPVSRLALLNAKFAVCACYCFLLMGFFLALSYGMGLAFYGPQESITVGRFDELTEDGQNNSNDSDESPPSRERASGVETPEAKAEREKKEEQARQARRARRRQREERAQFSLARAVISPAECVKRIAIALPLTACALLTVGSIAFFFSSFNKHPIAAMALTIGTYFLVLILQNLSAAENIIPLFKWLRPYLFTTAMDFWRGCFSYEIVWSEVREKAMLLAAYVAGFFGLAQFIFWRRDITS